MNPFVTFFSRYLWMCPRWVQQKYFETLSNQWRQHQPITPANGLADETCSGARPHVLTVNAPIFQKGLSFACFWWVCPHSSFPPTFVCLFLRQVYIDSMLRRKEFDEDRVHDFGPCFPVAFLWGHFWTIYMLISVARISSQLWQPILPVAVPWYEQHDLNFCPRWPTKMATKNGGIKLSMIRHPTIIDRCFWT